MHPLQLSRRAIAKGDHGDVMPGEDRGLRRLIAKVVMLGGDTDKTAHGFDRHGVGEHVTHQRGSLWRIFRALASNQQGA